MNAPVEDSEASHSDITTKGRIVIQVYTKANITALPLHARTKGSNGLRFAPNNVSLSHDGSQLPFQLSFQPKTDIVLIVPKNPLEKDSSYTLTISFRGSTKDDVMSSRLIGDRKR